MDARTNRRTNAAFLQFLWRTVEAASGARKLQIKYRFHLNREYLSKYLSSTFQVGFEIRSLLERNLKLLRNVTF